MWKQTALVLLLSLSSSSSLVKADEMDLKFLTQEFLSNFKTPTLSGQNLEYERFAFTFDNFLRNGGDDDDDNDQGDDGCGEDPGKGAEACPDFLTAVRLFTRKLKYDYCTKKSEMPSIDSLFEPWILFAETFKGCNFDSAESEGDRKLREEEEEQRRLQTKLNLACVDRLEEGDYNGFVDPAEDIIGGPEGGFNQYAWGTDYNRRRRYGVVIHSTGSPGALLGQYSLPTFTIRDVDANVVYEGVYASPIRTGGRVPPVIGLRSALVTDVFDFQGSTIISVVAATIDPNDGEFQFFQFNLDDYTPGRPVFGIEPLRRSKFPAPSVRAATLLSDSLILYAPLFDVGGSRGFPFLRIFNWRRFEDIETDFVLTNNIINNGQGFGAALDGLLWDFECEQGGLCFANSIGISEGNPNVVGDEDTIPVLSYFPLAELEKFARTALLAPAIIPDTVFIPTQVLDPTFRLDYSAQSFEPVTKESQVVCTLSGFLFRFGFIQQLPEDSDVAAPDFTSPEGLAAALSFFELGDPQECNFCRGVDTSPQGPLGIRPTGIGQCQDLPLIDQKTTTAYVWAVEECGDIIFIATYDIAGVLAEIIFAVIISSQAEAFCSPEIGVGIDAACAVAEGCNGDPVNDEAVCIEFVTTTILDAIPPAIKLTIQAGIISEIFGEDYTEEDFGFDLYAVTKEDLLFTPNPVARPITQNGFRAKAPGVTGQIVLDGDLSFDPTSQQDEAIRNMICHKDPFSGEERLILGSAVFNLEATSNTYVLDPLCPVF